MDIGMISLIGTIVGLVVLILLSYRGISLLISAPIATFIVVIFSNMNIVDSMIGIYSESLGGFVIKNFLLLVSASIFGGILGSSGAAQDIADGMTSQLDKLKVKNKQFTALVLLVFVFAILVYGGVSGFVIVFTMVPLCKRILKEYDIPWHLYMAIHSAGGNLFAATMLPGSPAVQNLIPIEYLGTTPRAAPLMGTAVALFAVVTSLAYIYFQLRRSQALNEGFLPTGEGINATILEEDAAAKCETEGGPFLKAIFPIIVVLILMNVIELHAVFSLIIGTVLTIIMYYSKFEDLSKCLADGALGGAKMTITVAAVTGFGGVVAATAGYGMIVDGLSSIPGSPLIQLVIAINVVAGITGSASAGLSIALETFSQKFLDMGYSPDVIHRIAAISCQGLDSLPHGSSVINQLQVAHLTHNQGYKHVFWIACIIPFVAGFVAVACYYLGII